MSEKPNWKTFTWIACGAIGLLAGLASAHMIIKNREENEGRPSFTSKDGLIIGVGLVSLLKQISEI